MKASDQASGRLQALLKGDALQNAVGRKTIEKEIKLFSDVRRILYINKEIRDLMQEVRCLFYDKLCSRLFSSISKSGKLRATFSADYYGSKTFKWAEFDKRFLEALKVIDSTSFLTPQLKDECREFLHHSRLMISAQIINVFYRKQAPDFLKMAINENSGEIDMNDPVALHEFRKSVLEHERSIMADEIKRYCTTMSKQKRAGYLDKFCAIALSEDFSQKEQEMIAVNSTLTNRLFSIEWDAERAIKRAEEEATKVVTPATNKLVP